MTRATVFLATLLGALATSAAAQVGGPSVGPDSGAGTEMGNAGDRDTRAGGERNTLTFTELDENNDGLLSEDEVRQSGIGANFEEMDQDGDSEVNRNEYFQYHRNQ